MNAFWAGAQFGQRQARTRSSPRAG